MTVNLTGAVFNATNVINGLNFASNCTIAMAWYDSHKPRQYWRDPAVTVISSDTNYTVSANFLYTPYENDTLNLDFLMQALPLRYANNSSIINTLQSEMSSQWSKDGEPYAKGEEGWDFLHISWYGHVLWQIASSCIGQDLYSIHLRDLNLTSNCSAAETFIIGLDGSIAATMELSKAHYSYPLYSHAEVDFWRAFLEPFNPDLAPMKSDYFDLSYFSAYIDGAVVSWYENLFRGPEATEAERLIHDVFEACRLDLCTVAGFTGNPDLAGIGVMIAYIFEASLVTMLWLYYLLSACVGPRNVLPGNLSSFQDCLEPLFDAAIAFLLGVSFADVFVTIDHNYTTYNQYIATIVVAIAYFNLLALMSISGKGMLEKKAIVLKFSLVITCCCVILTGAFTFQVSGNTTTKDAICLKRQLNSQRGPSGEFYGRLILAIPVALCASYIFPISRKSRSAPQTQPSLFFMIITFVFQFIVWSSVYLLMNLRQAMRNLAGDSWSEAAWGLGQAVALATWFPIPIIFVTPFLKKIKPSCRRVIFVRSARRQNRPRTANEGPLPVTNSTQSLAERTPD